MFSNCFVVFTVNFPENLSGTNSAISSVRGEPTDKNSARCGSDQTDSLDKDGAGYRFHYTLRNINMFFSLVESD